ncbi:MAG: chemotaxis protein CheA [Chthoniobacterales bacterium]
MERTAIASQTEKISQLLEQLSEELAFAIPGEDTGLLAINRCLMDMEDAAQPDDPAQLSAGLRDARQWIDLTLDGSAKFSEETIANLNAWHPWMLRVIDAWQHGEAMPAAPALWGEAATTAPPPAPAPSVAASTIQAAPGVEEKSITLNLQDDSELLREFHGESVELLQSIEEGLIVLEGNPTDADTINSIFRAFHTFKGGAGFLHLGAMQDVAHDLESLLAAARRGELSISSPIVDLILSGADALKHFTREIGAQLNGTGAGSPIVVPTSALMQRLQAALRGELPPAAPEPSPVFTPSPADQSEEPPEIDPPAEEEKPSSKTLASRAAQPLAKRAASAPATSAGPATTETSSGFVKLDTLKLDHLVDLVGELVIAQSMVVQNPEVQNLTSRTLDRCLRQLSRTTAELQRNAMSLRMVPVRGVFQKMSRLVRDLAAQQQKQIQLLLEGEDTELDRNIVEKLSDPLVHMVRNSVDHGLEGPAERMAAGKLSLGTIMLSASHQRGGICIRIRDDGRGLDASRILAKARERGLIGPDEEPDTSRIYEMIFMPGFSTAEKVTDLSGRGVGMDVVRRNIENLRGKIEIDSVPGEGTTFTIILPLTLAIIDGLLVGVGDDRYIIPTLSVRESFRARPGMVSTIQEHGEVVSVRGRQTPVLRLGPYLGRPSRAVKPEDGIMVVVESGDSCRALLVDELIGKQEVVIKSLGQSFQNQHLLAGAAVLGDGSVGLIFDVDSLVRFSDRGHGTPAKHARQAT